MLLLFLWRSSPAASPVRSSRTAGPTSSVQEPGTSSGCFEASFKSWKLSVDDSPLHPRGWISSKFHQHHPSAASPPPREPQPCPLQAGLDLRPRGRAASSLDTHLSSGGTGCSLYLQSLCSLAFSLLLSSQSPVISSLCYS